MSVRYLQHRSRLFARLGKVARPNGRWGGTLSSTLLGCALLGSVAGPVWAQSNVNESVSQTLYASPNGSTSADGRSQANAVTLSRAISLIGSASTKIILLNGDYRGSWRIGGYGNNTIILEAQNARQAVISGSSLVSSWNTESNGAFSFSWTNNWGLNGSGGFPVNMDALSQRREMVFINGTRLQQVCTSNGGPVSTSALAAGQFTVDEGADKIFFKPPSGVSLSGAKVEVATQTGRLLEIDDRDNVVVRGLKFQHSANYIRFNPALEIKFSNNVLVDNVQTVNNNGIGFELPVTDNVTVQNSDMSDNGSRGGGQGSCNNVLVQDSTFNRNNWRFWDLIGHDSAGWKIFDGDGSTKSNYKFLRCKFQNNRANGWWQDFGGDPPGDTPNVTIERCLVENNEGGIQQELTFGGLVIKDSVIRGNSKFNILSLGSPRMTIQNCFIYGVKASAYEDKAENCANLLIAADNRTNPNDGTGVPQDSRYFTITDNTIIATEAQTQIMKTGRGFPNYNTSTWGKDKFINTLTSNRNVWWRRDRSHFPAPYEFFGTRVFNNYQDDYPDATWAEWRALRSGVLDPNSLYQDANLSSVPDPTTTLIDAGTSGGTTPSPSGAPIGKTIGWKALNNNRFVSTNLNNGNYVQAGWATGIGTWERYRVVDAGSGRVALLSLNNNLYISCNINNSGYIQAGWASTIGAWERFFWEERGGGKFALKAYNNGLYVSNNLNASNTLQAGWATGVGAWEEFQWQETQ